jgi:hypothetical protein
MPSELSPENFPDIAMSNAGRIKFKELYDLSDAERNTLRNTEAYRLALMDIWEIAASARGIAKTREAFFKLFGQCVYGVMAEKVKIVDK